MCSFLQLEDADDVLEELEEALIVSGALRALPAPSAAASRLAWLTLHQTLGRARR